MSNLNGFVETKKHTVLMCTNVIGNNNKFYSLELQYNPTLNNYRTYSHYGRIRGSVISDGKFEEKFKYTTEQEGLKSFDQIIKKKLRGKKIKKDGQDYIEKYEIVSLASSSVGSDNVRRKSTSDAVMKQNIAADLFSVFGKKEQEILTIFKEENIHNITNVTALKINDGVLSTPLGPLTLEHLNKAKKVLDELADNVEHKTVQTKDFSLLNGNYFSLIPRSFGGQISMSALINNKEKLNNEYNLINQMETAISMNSNTSDSDKDKLDKLFYIEEVTGSMFEEIKYHVESSKRHSNLTRYKVKAIYQVENYKERKEYENFADLLLKDKPSKIIHKLDYSEIDVFHGSRNANILSILLKGFYVPPANASFTHGRMFGDGIYGADSSTKALNYSVGNWSHKRNKYNKSFIFVCRFAMGKVMETGRSLKTGCPAGYNSIYAAGGNDLVNNEYIVPSVKQSTFSYLVQLEE